MNACRGVAALPTVDCWARITSLPLCVRPRNFSTSKHPQPSPRLFNFNRELVYTALSYLSTRLRVSHVSGPNRVSRVHCEPCRATVSVSLFFALALRSSPCFFPTYSLYKRAYSLHAGHVLNAQGPRLPARCGIRVLGLSSWRKLQRSMSKIFMSLTFNTSAHNQFYFLIFSFHFLMISNN